jgi:hypothetical protein
MAAKKKATRKKSAAAPKPKHVTIAVDQRVHIHVTKDGKEVAEYIASPDGTIQEAPAPASPVQTPDPVSGT